MYSPGNRNIRITDFNKELRTFVQGKKIQLAETKFLTLLRESIKEAYELRAFFRTGKIRDYLIANLKQQRHQIFMGTPPYAPYERGSSASLSEEDKLGHSFLYKEVGFTTRNKDESKRRKIPGSFFFRDIERDVRLYVKTAAKVFFENILQDILNNGRDSTAREVANAKAKAKRIVGKSSLKASSAMSRGQSPKSRSKGHNKRHGGHDKSWDRIKSILDQAKEAKKEAK